MIETIHLSFGNLIIGALFSSYLYMRSTPSR